MLVIAHLSNFSDGQDNQFIMIGYLLLTVWGLIYVNGNINKTILSTVLTFYGQVNIKYPSSYFGLMPINITDFVGLLCSFGVIVS